jgi:hypothetical protein
MQPHHEVGAGTAIAQPVGAELVQARRPLCEAREMLFPGCHGVRLVETHAERDLLPQPLDVRLTEDLLGPALARGADADPVDRALAQQLHLDLHQLLGHGPAYAFAVEVGQQLGLGVARRRDERVPGRRPCQDLLPLRRVRQRLVGAELDHRPAHVPVAVEDVHVRRAGAVRLAHNGPREVMVLDGREEKDLLAGLHVRADADDELRVTLEAFVHCRRSYVNPLL